MREGWKAWVLMLLLGNEGVHAGYSIFNLKVNLKIQAPDEGNPSKVNCLLFLKPTLSYDTVT